MWSCHRQEGRNIQHRVHLADEVRVKVRNDLNGVTESSQVVFEVIGEMIAVPRGFIVELNVDNVVGVLVSRFDHADHVKGCS